MNYMKVYKSIVCESDDQNEQVSGPVSTIEAWFQEKYNITLKLQLPAKVGTFGESTKISISSDPSNIGVMSLVFEDISLEYKIGSYIADTDNGSMNYVVNLEFKWEHKKGSNGYSMRLEFDENGNLKEEKNGKI